MINPIDTMATEMTNKRKKVEKTKPRRGRPPVGRTGWNIYTSVEAKQWLRRFGAVRGHRTPGETLEWLHRHESRLVEALRGEVVP